MPKRGKNRKEEREREGGGYRTISWRLASVQVLCPQENAQSFVASTSKNENRKIKRRKQKIKNKTERPNKAEKLVKLALGNYALIFVAPLPTLPLSRFLSLLPHSLSLCSHPSSGTCRRPGCSFEPGLISFCMQIAPFSPAADLLLSFKSRKTVRLFRPKQQQQQQEYNENENECKSLSKNLIKSFLPLGISWPENLTASSWHNYWPQSGLASAKRAI